MDTQDTREEGLGASLLLVTMGLVGIWALVAYGVLATFDQWRVAPIRHEVTDLQAGVRQLAPRVEQFSLTCQLPLGQHLVAVPCADMGTTTPTSTTTSTTAAGKR